jgi:two-component system chemotaxis response regulator CheY
MPLDPNHPKPNILVVEDDRELRESLCHFLEDSGYQTQGAANGAEGLRVLLGDDVPGLVLLDLMMPIMSGTELLDRMRQDPRMQSIPVVLVSAWAKEAVMVHGAQGFLKKPIDPGALLTTVTTHLPA